MVTISKLKKTKTKTKIKYIASIRNGSTVEGGFVVDTILTSESAVKEKVIDDLIKRGHIKQRDEYEGGAQVLEGVN